MTTKFKTPDVSAFPQVIPDGGFAAQDGMTPAERNHEILRRFRAGEDINTLAEEYDLARAYVANIIRNRSPCDEIGLDPRVYWCLKNDGIDPTDIDAVANTPPADLLNLPNFGARSLNVLRDYLRKHGRDFAELDSPHLAITTPEQARQHWLAAVAQRDRAVQAVREARELLRRLEREAEQQGSNITNA